MTAPDKIRHAPGRMGALLLVLALAGCGDSGGGRSPARPALTTQPAGVRFTGTIYPHRYNTGGDRAQGHHAIVWKEGRAAEKALIEADVSDVAVQDQLEALGLEPANNLSIEAWTQRDDPTNPHPDERVKGPRLDVTVTWKEAERTYRLLDLLQEDAPSAIDIRFGGHRAYIDRWHSGCVTCLFSCPGGRTSNAAWTLRDQVGEVHPFHAAEDRLPPDGTPVQVTIAVAEQDEPQSDRVPATQSGVR